MINEQRAMMSEGFDELGELTTDVGRGRTDVLEIDVDAVEIFHFDDFESFFN